MFAPLLSWWQWVIVGLVPPAIVLLYFLKLRRVPVQVPSTYLWAKSIEDLHVNSLWQKLRKSLLLLLQLLMLAFAIISLLRPMLKDDRLTNDRMIFLIDSSASMSATDEGPNRLGLAKKKALEIMDQMTSSHVGMVISFSDNAKVQQMFTTNIKELRRSLDGIQPTNRVTSLMEALRAASGLANPGRAAFESSDTQVAEQQPAKVYIFSDGRVDDLKDFSLGSLEPVFVKLGLESCGNVGITTFTVRKNDERPGQLQAFGRIENYGLEALDVEAELKLDGVMVDVSQVKVEPGKDAGVVFDLKDVSTGVLELRLNLEDDLALDNTAWAAVNASRKVRTLLITPYNDLVRLALSTRRSQDITELTVVDPSYLQNNAYNDQAKSGAFDLIIYDRCAPADMPQANTLFIARTPPVRDWVAKEPAAGPLILDYARSHPLLQLVELSDVMIAEASPQEGPPTALSLIDSDKGTIAMLNPRGGFEDVSLSFEIVGDEHIGTNWPLRRSFPVFWLNVLTYLGRYEGSEAADSIKPGRPYALRGFPPGTKLSVTTPSGQTHTVDRGDVSLQFFTKTDELGVYKVLSGDQVVHQFTVNLFDSQESNIAPAADLKIGHTQQQAGIGLEQGFSKTWKIFVLLALVVLLLEWYIYNRKVYL